MKKICDFVNKNRAGVLLVAAGLTVVMLVVVFFACGANISAFGTELLHTVIVIAGMAVFAFASSKMISNKKFAKNLFMFFCGVLVLFFMLNVISLNITGMTAAIPMCAIIFLLTAARFSE